VIGEEWVPSIRQPLFQRQQRNDVVQEGKQNGARMGCLSYAAMKILNAKTTEQNGENDSSSLLSSFLPRPASDKY